MFTKIKRYLALLIALVMCLTFNTVNAFATTVKELNNDSVFLKQQTSITCTLASAAMMLRRTALCADYTEWDNITEKSIESEAWVDGVGLRWKFTVYGMSVDHGYFLSSNKKQQLIDLLKIYPQGFVIYNSGSGGQKHAVFLCDYDEENDIFYAADPANSVTSGRIPLNDTSIAGSNQSAKINNLNAYWFVTTPAVTYENGEFKAEKTVDVNEYDPNNDITKYTATEQTVKEYYIVTSTLSTVLREYPSGNAQAVKNVETGDLLYIQSYGNNNYGAKWYKTDEGYYIFSTNITSVDEYSENISKFNQTAVDAFGTYSAASVSDSSVAVRIDATEGNNIVAYINNGTQIYIISKGFNSAGALWLKTEDGYYIKASETEFVSSEKTENSTLNTEFIPLSGTYSAEPVEDVYYSGEYQLYSVTASVLNVRKSAVNGEIIGTLKKGENVEVFEIIDGWGRIKYNDTDAWVSAAYLVFLSEGNSNVSASARISTSTAAIGEKITCSVENEGDYQYKYFIYSSQGNIMCSSDDYTSKKTFTYVTDSEGEYYFGVVIYSGDEIVGNIYSANFDVYAPLKISGLSCNNTVSAYAGDLLTWSVVTSSVSSGVKYNYKLYFNGNSIYESESSVASFSYTPQKEGEYYVCVQLFDDYSTSETVTSEKINVVSPITINSFTLGATAVTVGDDVSAVVDASGGSGTLQFSFCTYLNNEVVLKTAYSSENSVILSFDAPGEYVVTCYVKDSKGTVVKESATVIADGLMYGDVDFNTVITSADARLVLRHAAQLATLSGDALKAADVTKDGNITSADARLILRCAANLEIIA